MLNLKICPICNKEFSRKYKESQNQWKIKKFCSQSCGSKFSKKGVIPWNQGKKLHYTVWNKGKKGVQIHLEETRKKMGESRKGEKNGQWKGGRKFWKEGEKKHLSSKYMGWSKDVKERDNWKCKIGNKDCHGRLESHHILNWIDFPELRYEVNNGITLCLFHHPRKKSIAQKMIADFQNIVS